MAHTLGFGLGLQLGQGLGLGLGLELGLGCRKYADTAMSQQYCTIETESTYNIEY